MSRGDKIKKAPDNSTVTNTHLNGDPVNMTLKLKPPPPFPTKKDWKLRPVSLHGKIKRKAHTIAVNNDQQHSSLGIVGAAAPPAGGPALLPTGRNVRESGGGRRRDGCWKLLGKRIRSVYVGQVAHCQLLKCANFLKLQRFESAVSLFTLFTLLLDCMDGCALLKRKAPFTSLQATPLCKREKKSLKYAGFKTSS